MTKAEAIQAMLEGKRVTHKYFTPEEWVSMEDGMIVTEDGYNFDPDEFWMRRFGTIFDENWKIFKE